ncbi:MAG TPA: CHASE3 domain-containing protein, partial [Polyangiaceae bacterium]|nr:CHASE3 domain-containing protein [Polyangiaceae bacterium]
MSDSWTFAKKVGVGFALAALILVLLAIVSYRTSETLIENDHWVDHTHEVRRTFADLLSQLKDTEAGVRGYVITGDDATLAPYRASLEAGKHAFEHARALTADNPEQQHRLDVISQLMNERLEAARRTIDARTSGGYEAATKIVNEVQAKQLMDRIRGEIADADQAEEGLLAVRAREAQAAADQTKTVMLWGSLLGVLAMAGVGGFIVSTLSRQIGTAVHQVQ